MFIAVLCIIAPNWKQPQSSSVGKWLNWYIHTMEYSSAIKKNKLVVHVITWMNFQRIMLSERANPIKLHTV